MRCGQAGNQGLCVPLPALTVPRLSGYRRMGVRKAPSTQHRAMHVSRSFSTMPCKLQDVNCMHKGGLDSAGEGKRWTPCQALPNPNPPHPLYFPCTALQPPEDEYARPAHLSGIPKGPIVLYQVSAPTSCLLSSPTPVPADLPHLLAPVPTCCPTSLLFVTWRLQSPDIARTFILFTV